MPSDDKGSNLGTTENDISGPMPDPVQEGSGIILRPTSHEEDVHFVEVWETKWDEKKVGVRSKRELSYIFSDELEWERHHQKWKSDRVKNTDMWEVDLSSVFYLACFFLQEGHTVTIDDKVWSAFLAEY